MVNTRLETGLLLSARVLVMLLPLCFLGGRIAVDVALSLTVILFLVRSAVARDWAWARSLWFKVGIGLWVWMLFISHFAFDSGVSYSQAAPWIRFLIFAAALETWVLNEAWMRRLLWVVTGVVVFVACDAWLQYLTGADLFGRVRPGETRLSGPFSGLRVGIFITDMMFPAVLGAFAWHVWDRGWAKAAWGLMVLVLIGAVFISGERMALLLVLAGMVFAAVVQRGALRALLAGVLSLAIVGMVGLALIDKNMFGRHVTETAVTAKGIYDSPYGQLWRSALHLAGERPLLGVGMKNFREACDDPVIGLPADVAMRCATHPHNRYLEFLSEAGVPGFIGFVLLVIVWVRHLWRSWRLEPRNPWLFGPMAAVVVYLWPLGPSSSFFSNWFGIIFWLCLGWALAAVRLRDGAPRVS